MNNETLFEAWLKAKQKLEKYKEEERTLREGIISLFPGDQGTSTVTDSGYRLKIVRGVTRSIDNTVLQKLYTSLSEKEKECVKYVPQLDAKKFAALPERSKLSRAVVIKPSLPTLTIEIFDEDSDD